MDLAKICLAALCLVVAVIAVTCIPPGHKTDAGKIMKAWCWIALGIAQFFVICGVMLLSAPFSDWVLSHQVWLYISAAVTIFSGVIWIIGKIAQKD